MQSLAYILEILLVMILTIGVLAVAGYGVLLILHWLLQLKAGNREQEGLIELWQATLTKPRDYENGDNLDNGKPG